MDAPVGEEERALLEVRRQATCPEAQAPEAEAPGQDEDESVGEAALQALSIARLRGLAASAKSMLRDL
tara:strand:+ start:766 stop:969 length:204 start_codon:yes stop_codon:yes gene_type:complete